MYYSDLENHLPIHLHDALAPPRPVLVDSLAPGEVVTLPFFFGIFFQVVIEFVETEDVIFIDCKIARVHVVFPSPLDELLERYQFSHVVTSLSLFLKTPVDHWV
jgi:hypothetical protein